MNGSGASTLLPYAPTSNPMLIIPLIAILCIFFLLRLYLVWKESHAKQVHTKKPVLLKEPERKKELEGLIKLFGFNAEQGVFFKALCVECKISNPVQFVHDPKAVEAAFGRKLQSLESITPPKPDTERQKTTLFLVREIIENRLKSGKTYTSTRAVRAQQSFTIIAPTGEQYASSVVENTADGILAIVPRDISGNELRLPVFTKIEIFFTAGTNNQSYRFRSRVVRYIADENTTRLLISHSKQLEALPIRKHERRTVTMDCSFSTVQVANVVNGKQTMHKFFPSKKSANGQLTEISVGGCSISAAQPLAMHSYLQIQCRLDGNLDDTMIGKVIRLSGEASDGSQTMHIQFVQLPRITMNRIFAFIYNHGDGLK